MSDMFQYLFGAIIFVLDLVAIYDIATSSKSLMSKILWIAAIIILPLVGLILYYLVGRTHMTRTTGTM